MAKCRNCKKEIDANATRCPYCLTEMPTSDFIATLKGVFIALILLGIFGLAMYYFISSIIRDISKNSEWFIVIILFIIGFFIGKFAITLLKWYRNKEEFKTLRCLIGGIVFAIISITLIVFSAYTGIVAYLALLQ
jgi:uncharacterized membrane protein YbjE (DUF340 family)